MKSKKKKERIWMNVDPDILGWVRRKITEKIFANETHCFEYLVTEKIKYESNNKK